jgi:hypothetical protein
MPRKSKKARKLALQPLLHDNQGNSIWLVQHDREELWLEYWYRYGCPRQEEIEFDVRDLPGYTDYPPRLRSAKSPEELMALLPGQRRHHAEIIASELADGWRPQ